MPGSEKIQSLERGLRILELVAQSENGVRIKDLAALTELKAPTVHNLVRTLRAAGYLEQVDDGCAYRLGPSTLALRAADSNGRLMAITEKRVRWVTEKYPSANVVYSELVGGEMHVKLRTSPDRPGVVQRPESMCLGLYNTASGMAALSLLDDTITERTMDAYPPIEFALRWWRSLKELDAALSDAKQKGYAVHPMAHANRCAIATIVADAPRGQPPGVLGMSWNGPGDSPIKIKDAVAALREAASSTFAHTSNGGA